MTSDVVIVGAGLAGLSAALELTSVGLDVVVLEASDAPGGRIRTDLVDGFRLDRGFQLINPSYPRVGRLVRRGQLDVDLLQLQAFQAGVRVTLEQGPAILADPRRRPTDVLATVRAPVGTPLAKLRLARWALRCATAPVDRLLTDEDAPYGEVLDRAGITGPLRTGVLDPFLAGVLGEDAGQTSARFVALAMRAFLHGTPAVPAWGMQRFPEQLVAALPSGVVQLNRRVKAISATGVDTDDGPIEARAVIVAADPATASALAGLPDVPMRALTTYWFAAEQVGVRRPILQVDGRREGPVVNAACLSAAAPAYSPDGRSLIAATVVGAEDTDLTSVISAQLSDMYLADAREWSLLRVDRIANALPVTPIPLDVRRPVELNERLFVAGDHRDTPSQQGALASGARAARAVQRRLGVA